MVRVPYVIKRNTDVVSVAPMVRVLYVIMFIRRNTNIINPTILTVVLQKKKNTGLAQAVARVPRPYSISC
ncbi:hypothetical protein ScPMuIL_015954 [Solemya velum]